MAPLAPAARLPVVTIARPDPDDDPVAGVAAAIANEHVVVGRTPMDVNLAKQLNILRLDARREDGRYRFDSSADSAAPTSSNTFSQFVCFLAR